MANINKVIRVVERPETPMDPNRVFKITEEPKPELTEDGTVLIRVTHLSLDPAMRGWLSRDTYIPMVPLNAVMYAGGLGEVIATRSDKFAVGDVVSHFAGMQLFAVCKANTLNKVIPGLSASALMGPMGMTGMTAYFGLNEIGKPQEGETVVVSGAAGATGSIAGQLAKFKGCRVIGIAGSDDKCAWLRSIGFDEVINYRTTTNMSAALKQACPKGIDVYFDNVGGQILDAVLARINLRARIVMCGAISTYDADPTDTSLALRNYSNLISRRGLMQGFIVTDFTARFPEGMRELGGYLQSGRLKFQETMVQGIEQIPNAFSKLFTGGNTGKLIVQVADSSSL